MKLSIVSVVLAFSAAAFAEESGILISPDEDGNFQYTDDFSIPKFLRDTVDETVSADAWQKGSITNAGPNTRTLTYRFYGDRLISSFGVLVHQTANSKNLGGVNSLELSLNGLDWTTVASSSSQEPDSNSWQRVPLTAPPEEMKKFVGHTTLWVRLELRNYSGLNTSTSNTISLVQANFTVGAEPEATADLQTEDYTKWGRLRKKAGWRSISLDWMDPVSQRPPHYYEDSDGWLQPPGENPHLNPDEAEGFVVQRAPSNKMRLPLSLVSFVKTGNTDSSLMIRLTVRTTRNSSRDMTVLWDHNRLASFDVASYFEKDKTLFVQIPGPQSAGVHELRIVGGDGGSILVRQIVVAGGDEPAWVEKPRMMDGGSLEALSAYYMPDPLPPADSQTVEGRHRKQEAGLIFTGMRRMYDEHADFGGIRIVLRNNPIFTGDRTDLGYG